MVVGMSVATLNELTDLIQPEKIREKLPNASFPFPKKVRLLESDSSNGDPAYYVIVVYPNNLSDEQLKWENVSPMVDWIRTQIHDKGDPDRFPYFRFRSEKEDKPGGW